MQIKINEAMEQYRMHRIAKGKKENTVDNNLQPVKHLWRQVGEVYVHNIRPQHIDKLFANGKWSPQTRNLYTDNLNLFFDYCRRMKFIPKDYDPMDGWDKMRVPEPDNLIIPVEEFPALLDACNHPRDRVYVAIGLFTFLRSSEITILRVDDVDLDANMLQVFRVKTSQPDTMPICAELKDELIRWMAWYGKAVGGLQSGYYLVPALHQQAMVYNPSTRLLEPGKGIQDCKPTQKIGHPYEIVQRALDNMGYSDLKQTGGHTLRRSGCRALFDQLRSVGYDGALRHCQAMLGHSDSKVTERYLGLKLERLQRNELLAGRSMFGDRFAKPDADVINLSDRREA